MRTYIYPENLRSTVKLWFWNVRDFCIICGGIMLSAMLFAKLGTLVPMASTICYSLMTFRAEDKAVLDYLLKVVNYFCFSQQRYDWEMEEKNEFAEKKEKRRPEVDRV
jgi:hypothetical protein